MNARLFAAIVVIAFGELFVANQLQAGCNHLFHHKAVVQQVVAQPIVLYSVGDAVLLDAAVERALQKRAAQPQPGTLSQTASVLASKCVRCHSGNEPAADIDFRWKVSDFAFRRTVEILGESIDVPDKMQGIVKGLTADEKGSITSELMRLPARKPEPVAGELR